MNNWGLLETKRFLLQIEPWTPFVPGTCFMSETWAAPVYRPCYSLLGMQTGRRADAMRDCSE